jgi:hypothetical protein
MSAKVCYLLGGSGKASPQAPLAPPQVPALFAPRPTLTGGAVVALPPPLPLAA